MQWTIAGPVILALILYAHFRKALTPTGILAAAFTAYVHANHPTNLPFALLCVFFLSGTGVTKIKHSYKSSLTLTATGTDIEVGRTHIQVLANSLIATALTWMHSQQLKRRQAALLGDNPSAVQGTMCYSFGGDILPIGIIACYAAAAADTFSSELGILARSEPRLITDPGLRKVPRGTNGGVTIEGLIAGLVGSGIIVATAMPLIPFCDETSAVALGGGRPFTSSERTLLAVGLTFWGLLGSLFDSWLGAQFQRSVKDVRTGKIVEGEGGTRAMTTEDEERKAEIQKAIEEHKEAERDRRGEGVATSVVGGEFKDIKPRQKPAEEKPTDEKAEDKPAASRVTETGWDILDNNDVNFSMTFFMSLTAMAVACQFYGVTLREGMSQI